MTFDEIKERCLPITGFEGYYITDSGDVYSTRPLAGRKDAGRLHKLKPTFPKNQQKYPNIKLCNNGRTYTHMIHRLVAEHFVPGHFEGAVVNHIDGNTRNNNASNLEWTTTVDNIHKSYITSGVDAMRNYRVWTLYDPDGNNLGSFNGAQQLAKFVIENNLDTSISSLIKFKRSRGYSAIVTQKPETVTTIREE